MQQWLKQRDDLEALALRPGRQLSVKKKRCCQDDTATADRGNFPELEASLVEWLTSMRQEGVTVSGECIKSQIRSLFDMHLLLA